MEGKRGLMLAMAPFMIFILLGSIFLGIYYRETSLVSEQVASMDELEGIRGENASWGGLCNIVNIYVTVKSREDAAGLEEFLGEERIRVAVSRHGERFISMRGRVALRDVDRIVKKGQKNGWVVAYHNNSDFCAKWISRFEMENGIISAHLNELSPESKEILTRTMEGNSERIEEIENETRLWAELNIMVQAGPAYTPESFHELSGSLATWGTVLGVLFLMWWVFKDKHKKGEN
ncbi:hypothetical protein [Thermococcus thioreducens]|uniref:Uncharacterized protein n=1 Tax=Thermococcus thioreducens TaxID=277988 RepID=A0A0Q2S5P3_9EURY|nr:hypothetical protein [Thermococcus thioreducens]ASJ12006.1 hypothetical protein A3L14_03500 [Thermococcus thioreducens]KQH82771.1 hypothetical protein AMR53_04065 [Thermococcus thioreducens]SEW10144.1 hypothetical protein SAMN05216170_1575 [Thermococcus thioreducens]